MVNKVFEKPVNNRIVDHLEKCDLFADFQYGFISSRSTANLLTVVCNRIASVFNRSGATRAVAQGLAWWSSTNSGLFWMGSVRKNIELILEFLESPFYYTMHLFYYILMTDWKISPCISYHLCIYDNFSSGYLIFHVFNNTTFFGTIQETSEK